MSAVNMIFSNKNVKLPNTTMHEWVESLSRDVMHLWESNCRLAEKKEDLALRQGAECLENIIKQINTAAAASYHHRLS
jgi:hypothetical protein